MSRFAFSLLELVFVIVVAAILSVSLITRFERDTRYEMAEQVLAHIRYTQHLALMDNVYQDEKAYWHQARWQMNFVNTNKCGVFYRIGADSDLSSNTADFGSNEAARDPITNQLLYNMAPVCKEHSGWDSDVLLGLKYNIVGLNSTCSTQTIAFDYLGRPYAGIGATTPTDKLMKEDCSFLFTDADGKQVKITIAAETGYAFITYI